MSTGFVLTSTVQPRLSELEVQCEYRVKVQILSARMRIEPPLRARGDQLIEEPSMELKKATQKAAK